MANIAAYPDWYTRSGMIDYRTEITEVAVVNSYTPTGHEIVSWDASAELNGTVTAYIVNTKLILVCDSLTSIPDKMFLKFLSLEKVSGLQEIITIGAYAFMLTPKLSEVDLAWDSLITVGNDAFRISSIEDKYNLSNLASNVVGERATRSKRWSNPGLDAVRAVAFPANKICLSVSNADSQRRYENVPYVTVNGVVKTVAEAACRTLSCYHIWNTIYAKTDKEYPDFITWFNDKLNRDSKYHENTDMSEACRLRDYTTLGWTQNSTERVISAAQLEYILDELSNGLPVYVTMQGTGTGYHSVVVIGCDPDTRKLAIVDSDMRTDKGVIYWVAYEDIFTEGAAEASEAIRKIDFNIPLLAKSDTWFTQGGHDITKESITEINIVLSYIPTGNETTSWDASAKNNGSVKCYLDGTKLTIAGNGDNYVYANLDSSYAFSDSAQNDYYSNLTIINGGNMLNTRNATTMERMFQLNSKLTTIDTSKWDTSNVESMKCMFQACDALSTLDVSNWNTSSVTTMFAMFNMLESNNSLTYLDTTNWNTSKVTSMQNMFNRCQGLISIGNTANWNTSSCENMGTMFNKCSSLKELNVSHWDMSKAAIINNMFSDCHSIEELNLSNWDVSNVTNMKLMFNRTYKLQKVTLGDKFSFKNGTVLPTPDSTYIQGADGHWYTRTRAKYTPADIPSNTAMTYYASVDLVNNIDYLVKNGYLLDIADAIRSKLGVSYNIALSQFVDKILAIESTGASVTN